MATLTTPGKFNGWLKGKNIAQKKSRSLYKKNPQNFTIAEKKVAAWKATYLHI